MRVLSLGGGQQSTAVYLMAANREIEPIDFAIFADTGEEPKWVYETVEALAAYRTPSGHAGAPILARWVQDSDGHRVRLGDQLIDGNEGRFASVPAFVKHLDLYDTRGKHAGRNAQGKGRRQCTREFKTAVVEATIRRELLGLAPGERYKGPRITQVFGFDFGEGDRIFKTKGRLAATPLSVGEFPLWDMQERRSGAVAYMASLPGWGREVLPSACTFCPLVNNAFRRLVRDRDPEGHARACVVDRGMRTRFASRDMAGELYVHRSMVPLAEVDLDDDDERGRLPAMACDGEGLCGH